MEDFLFSYIQVVNGVLMFYTRITLMHISKSVLRLLNISTAQWLPVERALEANDRGVSSCIS